MANGEAVEPSTSARVPMLVYPYESDSEEEDEDVEDVPRATVPAPDVEDTTGVYNCGVYLLFAPIFYSLSLSNLTYISVMHF